LSTVSIKQKKKFFHRSIKSQSLDIRFSSNDIYEFTAKDNKMFYNNFSKTTKNTHHFFV